MELIENYKDKIRPFDFKLDKEGKLEMELSVMQYSESKNKTDIQFLLVGLKNKEAFSLNFDLKRMTVYENGKEPQIFIPARIAISPHQLEKFRKPFFNILSNKFDFGKKTDFQDLLGVGLELIESEKYGLFNLDRIFNEKFKVIANNEISKLNPKYFEFGIEFDFPEKRIKIFETDLKYRKRFLDGLLK